MPAGKSAALTRAQWWECRIKSQHIYIFLSFTLKNVLCRSHLGVIDRVSLRPSRQLPFSVSIKHFTRRISRITCTLRNNNHARQAYYLFHDLGLLKLPWNDVGTKKL